MNPALDRDQPGKLASGVMAVVVHVAFFALLFFGVNWQRRAPDAVVVELWNNLPPAPAVKVQPPPPPPPPPKLEVKPPPPQPPQVKPEPKVAPKPEPKPLTKPDIALEKEKQEKARREEREKAEQKKRELQAKAAEEKKREERDKVELKKREEAERQKLAALERDRAAKEAERARLEKEQQEAVARIAQQQAAAQSKEVDEYRRRISDKIRRYVNKEPCAPLGNPEIVFEAVLLPDGNLLPPPRIRRSSGNAACDDAVLRAVMRAQPLPLPADPVLFARFRELNLQFRPNE